MVDKAKHAFGSSEDILSALADGKIDAYDILFLDGDTDNPKVGWIDRNGNPVIVSCDSDKVVAVDALPETGEKGVIYIVSNEVHIWTGTEFEKVSESTDLSAFEERVAQLEEKYSSVEELVATLESKIETKIDAEEADAKYLSRKYEITHNPVGTLVDYRDKEIRVMCPANTQWVKQNVGSTGNANMYYMGFRAYAPEGAVSFKEDDQATIEDDTMYYFEDNDFAGVDELGRKYSIVWLALASYDESSDTWTYLGEKSSTEKYIGWYYSVEWYDADGVIIASDRVRINLTNEECHLDIEPFYMADVTAEVKKYVDEQIEEISEIPVVEF